MVRNQLGGFCKPGRSLPPEIGEEIVDLYNAGYSMNEVTGQHLRPEDLYHCLVREFSSAVLKSSFEKLTTQKRP